MPGYDLDQLTYEVHVDPTSTAEDARNEPLRFYTTTVATDPLDEPLGSTITLDHITVDGRPFTIDAPTFNIPKYVTTDDFEHFSQKIYKIIEERTSIDISEEEFMRLIKDDS